jgi:hypothetical protein
MKRSSYIGAFVLFALTAATAFSVRSSTPQELRLPPPAEKLKEKLTPQQEKIAHLLRQVFTSTKDLYRAS